MRLRVGAATDAGRVRPLNEDVYRLRADQGLFLVCDGMGGASAGEIASRVAADAILQHLDDGDASLDETGELETGYLPRTQQLGEAVRRSNQVIYTQAQRNPAHAGMGTTVVGAWVREHVASVAHVGDSRAYLWHDGRLVALTRDHSLDEAQRCAGIVDDRRDAQHVLLQVLGGAPDVDVDLAEMPLQAGDYLLLCSDGLTRMVSEVGLGQAIRQWRDPQRICERLVETANRNGGADNITVVVVEVAPVWWRRLSAPWLQLVVSAWQS